MGKLDELKKLCDEATSGPWHISGVTDTRNMWQGQAYTDVLGVVQEALDSLEAEG